MKFAVAFDNHGVKLRATALTVLIGLRHEVLDLGTDSRVPAVSESEKASEIGQALVGGRVERGVIVSRSGADAAIAANKIDGVRASVCLDSHAARRGVEEDGMNVLCLDSVTVGKALAAEVIRAFASASLDESVPLARRLKLL